MASPLWDKIGAQKTVIKKTAVSKTNTGPTKVSSDQQLLLQALSAENTPALSTREAFCHQPDVESDIAET